MNPELESRLAEYDQSHLLQFYSELDPRQQQALEEQIAAVDLAQVAGLFQRYGKEETWAELARQAEPPLALRLGDPTENPFPRDVAIHAGEQALAAGQVAMILVAGGQGSRLGFEHPKGMYPLGPVSGRTLFQIHIDKLQALNSASGVTIPLYIMTSPATDRETRQFLESHDWFGYPAETRQIFCQGTMPAVDCQTGRLLLAEKGRLFVGPDGHGGMLAALHASGGLQDMQSRNVRQVFYGQIDNPLSQLCDAATIGYHRLAESEMSSQAVPKTGPFQKVGNIVSIDGKVRIIEYSDLPDDIAEQTNPDGSLKLWAGNIAVHVFDLAFLQRMAGQAEALPFHLAHKKVPFVDERGQPVHPSSPNAIKFERFIFDLLPMARHSIVVEVDPADAFSPVKNAVTETVSTPVTAQNAMVARCQRMLSDVGVAVASGVAVEIDPHVAMDESRLRSATAGMTTITEPTYLEPGRDGGDLQPRKD